MNRRTTMYVVLSLIAFIECQLQSLQSEMDTRHKSRVRRSENIDKLLPAGSVNKMSKTDLKVYNRVKQMEQDGEEDEAEKNLDDHEKEVLEDIEKPYERVARKASGVAPSDTTDSVELDRISLLGVHCPFIDMEETKRQLLKKKKFEVTEEDRREPEEFLYGAMDIDDESSAKEELHPHHKSIVKAVFARLNHKVQMRCAANSENIDMPSEHFTWRFRDDYVEIDDRVFVKSTGALVIKRVRPEDSGKYSCQVKGQGYSSKQIPHHLLVYQLPKFSAEVPFVYHMSACDVDQVAKKQHFLEDFMCQVYHEQNWTCPFSINSTCHERFVRLFDDHKDETKELLVDVKLGLPDTFKKPKCNVVCVKRAITMELDTNFEMARQLHNHEKEASTEAELEYGMSYYEFAFSEKVIMKCPPGYRTFKDTICLPCHPGTYSPDDKHNKCLFCKKGSYQANHAADSCDPCVGMQYTKYVGSTGEESCIGTSLNVFAFLNLHPSLLALIGVTSSVFLFFGCTGAFCLFKRKVRSKQYSSDDEDEDYDAYPEVQDQIGWPYAVDWSDGSSQIMIK
ncbi:hypothetical protein CAPTEDRAFT_190273 [Capitella teleta]|uniref:Ig-like domain-containing protein n=1 Tax=Capitella teleta TaxID=283909 RepID=R7VDG1_CAPTE|nr:hypothetical protein CAPTEDRAFT_190273 [Capitella teleta]|eukprot:ELU13695.1 hypothetical protein CAPTEDRAFT_190273 [Capitella teleta]